LVEGKQTTPDKKGGYEKKKRKQLVVDRAKPEGNKKT